MSQDVDYEKDVSAAVAENRLADVNRLCMRWAAADPGNETPRLILGRAFRRAGMDDRALEQFELAAEANPLTPVPPCEVGDLFLAAGSIKAAAAEYEKALKLDVHCPEALVGMGRVMFRHGRVDEATSHAESVLRATGECVPALLLLGDCFLARGEEPQAVETFRKAADLGPANPDAVAGYAGVLELTGRADLADDQWRRLLELEPDSRRAKLVKIGCWPVVARPVPARVAPARCDQPSWSPDGRMLAVSAPKDGAGQTKGIWIVDAGGATPPRLVAWAEGSSGFSPTWSPDGRAIAFHTREGNRRNVWAVPADGSTAPTLVSDATDWEQSPSFHAPTGRLVFESDGSAVSCLADGTDRRVLLPGDARGPRLAADGLTVFGFRFGNKDGKTLYRILATPIDRPGRRPRLLPTASGFNGQIEASPVANVIAFLSDGHTAGRWDVRVMGYPGGDDLLLVDRDPGKTMWSGIGWSPDGRRIAYEDEGLKVVSLGGLRPCTVHLSLDGRPGGKAIVTARNYGPDAQSVTLACELFDAESRRIAKRQLSADAIALAPGEAVELDAKLETDLDAPAQTAVLCAATADGKRSVVLVSP